MPVAPTHRLAPVPFSPQIAPLERFDPAGRFEFPTSGRENASLPHSLNPQHSQPSPRFSDQLIHVDSRPCIFPPPPRIGRGRDERLAGRVRVVGVSILTASGLLGDLRGVTLRLGSGEGRPCCLCRREGGGCSGRQGPGRTSRHRIISQGIRHPEGSDAVPGCGAGRKSHYLPTNGVDRCPAPPPEPPRRVARDQGEQGRFW